MADVNKYLNGKDRPQRLQWNVSNPLTVTLDGAFLVIAGELFEDVCAEFAALEDGAAASVVATTGVQPHTAMRIPIRIIRAAHSGSKLELVSAAGIKSACKTGETTSSSLHIASSDPPANMSCTAADKVLDLLRKSEPIDVSRKESILSTAIAKHDLHDKEDMSETVIPSTLSTVPLHGPSSNHFDNLGAELFITDPTCTRNLLLTIFLPIGAASEFGVSSSSLSDKCRTHSVSAIRVSLTLCNSPVRRLSDDVRG